MTSNSSSIFGAAGQSGSGSGTSLFGTPNSATTSSIFGTAAPPQNSGAAAGDASTNASKPTSIFGSPFSLPKPGEQPGGQQKSSFFNLAPSASNSNPATSGDASKPNLFGSTPGGGASTSGTSTPPLGGNLFGGSSSSAPAPAAGNPPVGASLFGGGNGTASTPGTGLFSATTTAGTTASANPNGGMFGGAAAATSGTATPPAGTSLFGLPPKPATNATTSDTNPSVTKEATPPAGGLFANLTKPGATPPASTPPPASAPSTSSPFTLGGTKETATSKDGTTASSSTSLFGAPKPEEKKEGSAPSTSGTSGLFSSVKTDNAAASSSVPSTNVAVPPPSVLKGKSVEEIVNKWTADVEVQVREFHKLAGEIAVWDRALIENGNNLAALYSHVLAAEREQTEIDQTLDHIEQQQRELAATLDTYEKSAQEIFGGQGGLRALDAGPADSERDKNYTLATDLHSSLDDLSTSLTQMIETVNALSVSSSEGNATEDPMSQISQILSSHLDSLQWIDGAVREVEGKVTEVEKKVKESSYANNLLGGGRRGFGLR